MEKKNRQQENDNTYVGDDYIPNAPDGGWGWMVTLASFVVNFIVDGIGYAFGVLLPEFAEHFGESKGKVSLVGSLLFGVYLCSGPIASGFVNKFGCRIVTIAGSILAAIGFGLGSLAPNLDILILTYGIMGGLGFGLMYLPSIVTVGYYFERRRALATGIAMCGSGVGTFIFSPLNDYLLEVYGWRGLLMLHAGIILNGAVCAMLMRPLEPENTKYKTMNDFQMKQDFQLPLPERADTDPNHLHDKYVNTSITNTKTGGSLPAVHIIQESASNSNGTETINQTLPLIVKEITPTSRTRSDSQPAMLVNKLDYARPLYRKDIFYSGSIDNIPQFRSQPNIRSYITSITSIPGISAPEKSSFWDKCTCLPKTMTDVLKEMLDFSLMLKLSFFMLFMGNLFACTGYFIPFSYIVDQSVKLNITRARAAFLISIMGISNTVGRVLCGFLADLPFVNPLVLNNIMLLVSSVALFLEPFCTTYTTLVIFSLIYGLCIAAYISMTSPIICSLLGIDKLSNAFGLLILSRGMSGIYGPPLAGAVFQATESYDASFYLGGGMYLAGAICHLVLHLPCLKDVRNDEDIEVEEVAN